MTAQGHEDAFPRLRLSARCRFSQGTFAGTWGNGRDAPIPVIRCAGDGDRCAAVMLRDPLRSSPFCMGKAPISLIARAGESIK